MCTLTYRLTENGYQLFFNRDEQITRPHAIAPALNTALKSIYPIDPTGGGTWIAAHESGVSLALLNYYQAQIDSAKKIFTSRGVIIPHLLTCSENIHVELMKMDLTVFQAFKLCVFGHDLSMKSEKKEQAKEYIWDGKKLTYSILSAQNSLPITSSSVDYEFVYAYRKEIFKQMIITTKATSADYITYHQHQGESGKCSIKMARSDAQTVSFTQINVNQSELFGGKVKVEYVDYLNQHANESLSLTF